MAERYPARKRAATKKKLEHEEEEEASEGSDEHSDGFIKPKLMSSYYNFPELLESKDFEHEDVVQTMSADDFTKDYISESGLRVPLIFHDRPEKLGMRMPPADRFTVRDVMNQVGENRRIEVVQVDEQSGKAMLMKDFVEYYETPEEERGPLLNVLSLEFSATQLAETVKPPAFVHDLDWVEKYWPEELKQRQKISVEVHGETCDFSTYPKVQRYCLMSVKGCYTDFHMDFGGTSVWYHVLKGEKIFWIVEPTETNIFLYEEWLRTNGHNEAFFGKAVERCTRVQVLAGDTFVIPSCWIHSVYTPQDSLVFGGNFLHSYAIPGQIRAAQSEDKIRISGKYRYPYFKQMLWYYMEHIVRGATGRVYLKAISVDPRERPTFDNRPTPSEEHPHILRGGLEVEDDEDALPSEPTVYYDDPKGDDWINDPEVNLFIPTQRRISLKDYQPCTTADSFNQQFLESLTQHERIGLFKLRDYATKLVKKVHKNQQFAEGITRPRHLLSEFANILDNCFADMKEELEESSRSTRRRRTRQQSRVSVESNTSNEAEEEVKQKEAPKQRKRPSSDKKPTKPTKQKKGEELPPPIAHPQDIHESNPEYIVDGKAYCPLDEALPLGKKPLQSAFRKTSNMAEKPKTNAFVYKARNVQAVAEKESANEVVDSESAVHEKRTPTIPHHAARPAKRANVHPTSHGVPEFEYRSPLGPSTSTTATTDSAVPPLSQTQKRSYTASSSSRPPSDARRRFSAGAEHGSFATQSFGSNARPPHSSAPNQFSPGAQNAPYRPQGFSNGGNPANPRGPPPVVQPNMAFAYVGIQQAPPPPPPPAQPSDLMMAAPPPPAAAPISRNAATTDAMLVGAAAPPSAPTSLHLPPNDPRPQGNLPEQPNIDFMHAANLLEGIGHELEGTRDDRQPLDPATSLDALASIQQAFDDAF